MKNDLTDSEIHAIASFRSGKDHMIILELFKKRLANNKTLLVRAKGDVYMQIQGRAQEQEEMIDILTLNNQQR